MKVGNYFNDKLLKLSFTLLSIVGYGFFVFAAAPTGGYIPGQTNDPQSPDTSHEAPSESTPSSEASPETTS